MPLLMAKLVHPYAKPLRQRICRGFSGQKYRHVGILFRPWPYAYGNGPDVCPFSIRHHGRHYLSKVAHMLKNAVALPQASFPGRNAEHRPFVGNDAPIFRTCCGCGITACVYAYVLPAQSLIPYQARVQACRACRLCMLAISRRRSALQAQQPRLWKRLMVSCPYTAFHTWQRA